MPEQVCTVCSSNGQMKVWSKSNLHTCPRKEACIQQLIVNQFNWDFFVWVLITYVLGNEWGQVGDITSVAQRLCLLPSNWRTCKKHFIKSFLYSCKSCQSLYWHVIAHQGSGDVIAATQRLCPLDCIPTLKLVTATYLYWNIYVLLNSFSFSINFSTKLHTD